MPNTIEERLDETDSAVKSKPWFMSGKLEGKLVLQR